MHSLKGKITCFFLNNHSFYVRKFRGLTSQHHQSQKNICLCLLLFLLLQQLLQQQLFSKLENLQNFLEMANDGFYAEFIYQNNKLIASLIFFNLLVGLLQKSSVLCKLLFLNCQFNLDRQSRQKALRAYCSNIYCCSMESNSGFSELADVVATE